MSHFRTFLVFVPKYRRHVFDADALERLENAARVAYADFAAALVELLKGVSSRRLRQTRPDLTRRYWRGGWWSASYFVASVGGAPLSMLRQYIESQRAPGRSSPP